MSEEISMNHVREKRAVSSQIDERPVFMRRPVQRKSAANAAHGPCASREKAFLLDSG